MGAIGCIIPFAFHGNDIALSFYEGYKFPGWNNWLLVLFGLVPAMGMAGTIFNVAIWSVDVEAVYYLAVPLIAKIPVRALATATALSLATFFLTYQSHLGFITYPRFFGLFALGYMLYGRAANCWARAAVLTVPALCCLTMLRGDGFSPYGSPFAPILAIIGSVAIIYGEKLELRPAWQKVALYLGDISFPLYLVHWPVAYMVALSYPPIQFLQVPMALPLQLLVAALIFHLIDKPLRRLGREPFFRRRPAREPVLAETG